MINFNSIRYRFYSIKIKLKSARLKNPLLLKNPYMDLDNDCKCIFIHIPKCAGWSISNAIYGSQISHKRFLTYKHYDKDVLNKYFVFSLIRNPIERFVSAFNFLKSGGINKTDLYWSNLFLSEFDSINSFIKEMSANPKFLDFVVMKDHFQKQCFFLEDEKGEIDKNIYLIPFNKISCLPKILKSKVGLSINLRHLNKTKYTKAKEELTKESLDFLVNYYDDDIYLYESICGDFKD